MHTLNSADKLTDLSHAAFKKQSSWLSKSDLWSALLNQNAHIYSDDEFSDHSISLLEESVIEIIEILTDQWRAYYERIALESSSDRNKRIIKFLTHPLVTHGDSTQAKNSSEWKIKIEQSIYGDEPIVITLPSFPRKYGGILNSRTYLPDLGEVNLLIRLSAIDETIKTFYEPGVKLDLLSWGGKRFLEFNHESSENISQYISKLRGWSHLIDLGESIHIIDFEEMLKKRFSGSFMDHRESLVNELQEKLSTLLPCPDPSELHQKLTEIHHGNRPLPYLDDATAKNILKEFPELFWNVAAGINYSHITSDPASLIHALFSIYTNQFSTISDLEVEIVKTGWRSTIGYAAQISVDRALEAEMMTSLYQDAIRGTIHPKAGQLSFILKDEDTYFPWLGNAAINKSDREQLQITTHSTLHLETGAAHPRAHQGTLYYYDL